MKIIKNANNILEILNESGKVIIRMSKTEENASAVQSLLESDEYNVINYNVDVQINHSEDRDWTQSLINN